MELKRVVVTGLGAVTPLGKTVNEYWEGMVNGVSGADWITRFNPEKFKTKFACQVKDFNSEDYFDRKEVRKLDLYTMYALVAADESIKDSELNLDKVDKDRVGVIFGSGIGGFGTVYSELIDFSKGEGIPRFSPFFIPKLISDIAAGHISIRYGFRGPNYATVSACATSTNAIVDAFNYIRLNKADLFVTGGSEAAIVEPGIGGFNSMQAMSTNNAEYKTASRPFDHTRDGFVMGEGSGALILEELEHARKRGARIYAELVGGGMSADAYHLTAPHPDGDGAYLVMKNALEDAGMEPEEIDYINVHGTATPRGDISEARAITKLFGEHAYKMNISATKSMTGHLLGAAGAIEAIASILAIRDNTVPPTINFKTPDPEIDPNLNLTYNKAQQRVINVALSNTFGFGGHNFSVIFKKYTE
ncbi:MAG: beta-ketoacyl-ACP synthase II [Bacteroidales bacterium]|nr:beta-ketoacyl-ACP synthase II [Bacteroidales bacterium]MBN2764588.1 beta-ketoacyl-ACP synthase II [Bacteroidales bacterium]